MKIEIVAKNYQVKEALNEVLIKKVSKLDRYFDGDSVCRLYLKAEKRNVKMEIQVNYKGCFIRAEAIGDNFYDTIDILLPKLERQMYKHRSKLESKLRENAFKDKREFAEEPQEDLFKLVKSKQFEIDSLSVEEAIEEFELTGHNFYLFFDKDANKVKLLYLRDDGNIGLIDPIVR